MLFSFTISFQYIYEPIKNNIPKSSYLYLIGENYYKIYEYTPSCGEDDSKTSKNIYLGYIISNYLGLIIYNNYSNINKTEDGYFINYIDRIDLYYSKEYYKLSNLKCKNKYYFILSTKYNEKIQLKHAINPVSFKFFIFDDKNVSFYMNPAISNEYIFFSPENKLKNLIYNYTENKVALIDLDGKNMQLEITENNTLIYNHCHNLERKVLKLLFRQNYEYNIFVKDIQPDSSIYFQFFNDSEYIKYDFTQSSLLLYEDYEYYIEVDISNYKLGEDILFLLFDLNECMVKYQYKEKYKDDNLIILGYRSNNYLMNYIRIKKEIEDNYLILYLYCQPSYSDFDSFINIFKHRVEHINSDGRIKILEPKILFLDYNIFNGYNSFGIYSNKQFYFIEEIWDNYKYINKIDVNNIIIVTKDLYNIYNQRNAFIIFNDNIDDSTILEFKKFDYPIISYSGELLNQYYLFEKENEINRDFYFYINNDISYKEIFIPVINNYESYFIKKSDIKTLSDFNFDKASKIYNFNYIYDIGYLKLKSNEYSMFQHIIFKDDYYTELKLSTGKKYYFYIVDFKRRKYITFSNKCENKTISLKIRSFGLNSNESFNLIINETKYLINNTELEIDFLYNRNDEIYFSGDFIKVNIILEIKVAFLEEDLAFYKQIDFNESIGELSFDSYNSTIIRIPKNLSQDLFDYSIIVSNTEFTNIQISYDVKKFAVPFCITYLNNIYPITNLFKKNPYLNIKNEENKFIYLTINIDNKFNYNNEKIMVFIKKPKIYDKTFYYNKINIIPKLADKNNIYYYKIKIPKSEQAFILIQSFNNNCSNFISNNELFYKSSGDLYFTTNTYTFYNNLNSESLYIISYETNNFVYINLVRKNEYYYYDSLKLWYIITLNITQIEGQNKIKIRMNSMSYYYNKTYIYYLFINIDSNAFEIYKILTKQKNPDVSKGEKLIVFEDFGANNTIEYIAEIGIELNNYNNKYIIIPVNKENNIIDFYREVHGSFEFKYISQEKKEKKEESSLLIYYLIGPICLVIIVIIIIIINVLKKKCSKQGILDTENIKGNLVDDNNE